MLKTILVLGLCCSVLQLHMNTFVYQRDFMWHEPWRWWTGHWVHVGWRHYLLNMLAFLCLPFLFPQVRQTTLLASLLILPPLLSAGLYWLLPQLQAYAGLSGLLHGIFALVAIQRLQVRRERKFAILVLGCIVLKVGLEKWMGYSETAQLIQAPVLIESHQIGLVTGIVFALLSRLMHGLRHWSASKKQVR